MNPRNRDPAHPGYDRPLASHSVQRTVVSALLVALLPPLAVLAVSAPVAVGLAAVAVGFAVLVARRLRRRLRRQSGDRTRRVCVPGTGVCVEA